jgi:hypothetical protein
MGKPEFAAVAVWLALLNNYKKSPFEKKII